MKNGNTHDIDQGRQHKLHKAARTDILVIPEVVEENKKRLADRPRRRRRIDYAKKIMNDPFIMSV